MSLINNFYLIAFSSGFSKVINLLSLLLVTKFFFDTYELDLFFLLFNYSITIAAFANSIDNNFILPQFKSFLFEGDYASARLYSSGCLSLYTVISIFCLIGAVILKLLFLRLFQNITFALLLLTCANLFTTIISTYFINFNQFEKKYLHLTIALVSSSAIKLLCILLLSKSLGVEILMMIQILANLVTIIVLFLSSKEIRNYIGFINIYRFIEFWESSKKSILFIQFGNLSSLLFGVFNITILSSLGKGILSGYNIALQLLSFPQNIIVEQVGTIAAAEFNSAKSHSEGSERKLVANIFFFALSLILPATLFLSFSSQYLVDFVFFFFKGKSISTEVVNYFLKYLAISLPFLMINTVSAKYLFSKKIIKSSSVIQVAFNLVLIFLIFILSRPLGPKGYIIAYNGVYLIYVMLFLPYYLNRSLKSRLFYPLFLKMFAFIGAGVSLFMIFYFYFNQINLRGHIFINVALSLLIFFVVRGIGEKYQIENK